MKTSLTFASLFLAASVPSALAVELIGVDLPAGIDATAAFGAFVVSLVALIAFADYTRAAAPLSVKFATRSVATKAAHPLAA